MASALLDTGPLVALFKRNDAYHARSVSWFKAHRGPLLTTQAVITEAWQLVSEPAQGRLKGWGKARRFPHTSAPL